MKAIREMIGKLRGKPPEGERRGTYKAVKKLEDERGLSPVIATVILVAVAITVAVAVSYWMSGIAGQYTSFEKIELPAHYSKCVDNIPVIGEAVGTGDGERTVFQLDYPVVAGTDIIKVGGQTKTRDIAYLIDETTGEIIFQATHVPAASATIPIVVGESSITGVTVSDDSTKTESWTVTYVLASTDWTVEGTVSGVQTFRATGGTEYTSDGGEIKFTVTEITPTDDYIDFDTYSAEITADYSRDDWEALKGWKEYIELKNSGSKDATITNVFLNNIPIKDYGGIRMFTDNDLDPLNEVLEPSDISIVVAKGESVKLILWISRDTEGCSPGTTIDLKIVSASGSQYPLLEVLA